MDSTRKYVQYVHYDVVHMINIRTVQIQMSMCTALSLYAGLVPGAAGVGSLVNSLNGI